MKTTHALLIFVSISLSILSHASFDEAHFGQPVLSTHCQGHVEMVRDSDNYFVLHFDYLHSVVGDFKHIDRKSCALAIPAHIPEGKKIILKDVNVNGSVFHNGRASSTLLVEYFFAGSFQTPFKLVSNDSFGNFELVGSQLVEAACGQDVNLRMNLSTLSYTKEYYHKSAMFVDKVKLFYEVIDC